MAVSREQWDEARRLVVSEECSYAQAAEATGISLSSIQKRAGAEGWQGQRDIAMSYTQQVRGMKAALLAKLVRLTQAEDADANQIASLTNAWTAQERAYPEHRYTQQKEDPQLRTSIAIEVLEEVVSYFRDADANLLAKLGPHIRPITTRLQKKYAAA